jgi:virulence-associated protein VapD
MAPIEGMSGNLDIFERPLLQTGIIGDNWYQYKPTSVDVDATQLEFRVPGKGDHYLDYSRTVINVKLQITKADGSAYLATDGIAPVNNLLDILWSNVKVEFHQKTVSDARNMYHYHAYIEDLFNFNNTAKDTHLTASLWDMDTPGKFDDGDNPALLRRRALTDVSKTVDLAGKLHCDLFSTSKYMLKGVDFRFIFVKNKIESILVKASAAAAPKLNIVDASLWNRKLKINPSILLAHANNLNHHTAKY